MKLCFIKVFNSVTRDSLLNVVKAMGLTFTHLSTLRNPLLPLCSVVVRPSSAEGVQQDDPLGPFFFCLATYRNSTQLLTEFCIMFQNDVSLGGTLESYSLTLRS